MTDDRDIGDANRGDVYDLGNALAIYWPDDHPCHPPAREQWIVLQPDGGVSLHAVPPREDMTEHRLGRLPGLTQEA